MIRKVPFKVLIKDTREIQSKHFKLSTAFNFLIRKKKIIAIFSCCLISFYLGIVIKGWGVIGLVIKPALANILEFKNTLKGLSVNPDHVYIHINYMDFQKLAYKRQEALAIGTLFADSKDYVPALIRYKGKSLRAKIRLKGDHPDHFRTEKWSFRIEIKDDKTLFGMKQFSIQHPMTRNYAFEWLFHQALKREGVLSLRYKFIQCSVNGKDWGIYALEEHFDKRLVEFNQLREGPIIRFDESVFWQLWREMRNLGNPQMHDKPGGEYLASFVDSFQTNYVLSSEQRYAQYKQAFDLLESLRRGLLTTSEVFDVEKLAKYFALIDLFGAEHSSAWHNARFYYNPITSRLEPIGFDADAGVNIDSIIAVEAEKSDWIYYKRIFGDMRFFKQYMLELERISKKSYVDTLLEESKDDLERNINILYREFPTYTFTKSILYANQDIIKATLDTKQGIHAYFEKYFDNKIELSIGNAELMPIEILNCIVNDDVVYEFSEPKILVNRKSLEPVEYSSASIILPKGFLWSNVSTRDIKISYRILGSSQIKKKMVFPWPFLDEKFIKEDLIRRKPNIKSFKFIITDEINREIIFSPGTWTIDKTLIIPHEYRLICFEGTSIDLTNSAMILCYAPIEFIGSEDKPIAIYSSDSQGRGVVVLNAQQKSILRYVYFNNLSNPISKNWELSGAITFYESPVDMINCQFLNSKAEDGLNIVRSNFSIKNTFFSNSFSDAFDSDFSIGEINNSTFIKSGNDAIDVSGSSITLTNINIIEAGDKGISVGERSQISADTIEIKEADIAAVSKDESQFTLNSVRINDCDKGLALYQKKSEFGPAKMAVKNSLLTNVRIAYLVEDNSELIVDGKKITTNQKEFSTNLAKD